MLSRYRILQPTVIPEWKGLFFLKAPIAFVPYMICTVIIPKPKSPLALVSTLGLYWRVIARKPWMDEAVTSAASVDRHETANDRTCGSQGAG